MAPLVEKFSCPICFRQFGLKGNMKAHMVVHSEEKKFECPLCPFTAKRQGSITTHEQAVHGAKRSFQCPKCPYAAKIKSGLTTHIFNRHSTVVLSGPLQHCLVAGCKYQTRNPRNFKLHETYHARSSEKVKCPLCNFYCVHRGTLTFHMRRHTGEAPYKCGLCPYEAKNSNRLKEHCANVHPPGCPQGMFKCPRCPVITTTLSQLHAHFKTQVHRPRRWRCKVINCSFSTLEPKELAIHLQAAHSLPRVLLTKIGDQPAPFLQSLPEKRKSGKPPGVDPVPFTAWKRVEGSKPFGCLQCPYKCARKLDLRAHVNTAHSSLRPFKCPHEGCNHASKTNGDLRKHCLNHLEVKSLKCPQPQCKYKTNQKTDLKRHIRIHSDRKDFKCSLCQYETNRHRALAAHIRVHTGETPYICRVCGYQTRLDSCLHRHMKTHKSDRQAKCPKCPFSSATSRSLKVHLKTMHTGREK